MMAHLENILSADWATLVVVAALCGIAAYAIKEYLAHPPLIVFVYPLMIFFGLTAYYIFVTTEQLNPKKIDQWLTWAILASICGTVLGILIVSLLAALRERLAPRHTPVHKPTRVIR